MEAELRSLIARVRRRWFRVVALRTIGRATLAAAIPIGLAVLVDAAARPQGWALIALTLAATVIAMAGAGAVLYRMQRRPDDRHVARYIEERAASRPGARIDDELVSAVDVADGRVDPGAVAFKPLILAAAVKHIQALDPATVVDAEDVRRARIEAAGGVLLLALVVTVGLPSLRRAGEAAWIAAFPGTVHVDVSPGNARVVAGRPLQIRASLRGSDGVISRLTPELEVTAGDQQRAVPMVRDGAGYRFDFESVDRTFRYRVAAGTARSPEFTVAALIAARVERIDLRYQYPAFSGLAPREEEDGGDIYAPAGTRVRLRIHTDKPVTSGQLALGEAGPIALRAAGDKVLEGELTLARDDSYRINLVDADTLPASGDSEYFIRLMDDRPPDVRILRPSSDQHITPLEEIAIEARADDDYGISAFDLVYSVSGKPERVIPFSRVTGTAVQKTGAYLLPAEELGVQPGDVIAYYARARDVGRGKRPTEARSDMFFLEVKPFGEEFVASQSQAGGGGASGAQIESLIAAQKEIINATWNIERRSGSGRSDADIKAVAQAQAELRSRAEQMTRGAGRRGGPFPQRLAPQAAPPSQRPPRAGDPVAAAVDAMARAHQQLEASQTRDALSSEMAALNALLQAQADVRRRQVQQQQRASGSGGGGSNRSEQDLSALFDKELQRQQRTNYETRSRVEERPDRTESRDSALDRIRDLARRQEELTRQQRELAQAKLSAEELKRRLEKLTREQAELRQQAEELARRQQGQGGGSAMRDVSEQMRDATSDLRRQDAQSASQKGERAVDQLRRMEQQMQGAGGQSGQPSTAGLQVEAQQIAEAQRRIASEAERLDRDGAAAGSEARRRLAEEKERLAGRVDDLQRAARQAGQAGKGTDATSAADAARELERQQLGRRMREGARQMRDGSQPRSGPGEQQLARALDDVVEKLGGASAEARRLSQELNQTKEMRDRLNRLEQQIRETEARQRGSAQAQTQAQRGQQGRGGRQGEGAAGEGELQRLRQEYQRELQRAKEALGRLGEGEQRSGAGATPEQHEYSRSAPGTEQFKQDRTGWDVLRKDVDLALERYEAALSSRLARKNADDRLSAGASDRVPEKYRDRVAKYFQSLAGGKK